MIACAKLYSEFVETLDGISQNRLSLQDTSQQQSFLRSYLFTLLVVAA